MGLTNAEWMIMKGYRFSDITFVYSFSHEHIYVHNKLQGIVDGYGTSAMLRWLDEEHQEDIKDPWEVK